MIKILLVSTALFVGLCYCLPQGDLSVLIEDVFGKPPTDNNNPDTNFNQNPNIPNNPRPVTSAPNNDDLISEPKGSFQGIGCSNNQECVTYYNCINNTIITDGVGLIDVRIDDNEPKECPFLKVCCSSNKIVEEPLIKPVPLIEHGSGCGYRNVDGVGFKITGNNDHETQFGEFPWMVAILKEEIALDTVFNIYQCGGALITPSIVLTAAHCVQTKKPTELLVRAGEWDTQGKSEIIPDQDSRVKEMVIHEQYYKGGLFNDIALLFLETPFEIAENVNTVCLPPANTNFDFSRCFATGWGKDTFDQKGKYSLILKKIDLPMVPNDQCQKTLRKTRLGTHFELHKSFVCAGGERGKDTCKGDGGSPLVCPIPGAVNRYYQAGIVAWGIGCGDEIPGVYASVAHLRPWIDEQLAYKRVDKTFFTP